MRYIVAIRDSNGDHVGPLFVTAQQANDYVHILRDRDRVRKEKAQRYYVALVLNEYTAERRWES